MAGGLLTTSKNTDYIQVWLDRFWNCGTDFYHFFVKYAWTERVNSTALMSQITMPGTQSAILWQIQFQITMPGTQSAILRQIRFQITMPGTQSAILWQIRFQITIPWTESAIIWQIRFRVQDPQLSWWPTFVEIPSFWTFLISLCFWCFFSEISSLYTCEPKVPFYGWLGSVCGNPNFPKIKIRATITVKITKSAFPTERHI